MGNTRIHRGLFIASLACATCVAFAPASHAQSNNAAVAEALFAQGRSLMKSGDYQHACPKFVESQRLDPASGTLLNIGACYEKIGRTASAWAAFKEAASAASIDGHADRVQFAKLHIEQLTPKLSYLTVLVAPGGQVDGLKVLVDGIPLNPASWGVALPMDPGVHKIQATAPGHVPWNSRLKLGAEADKKTVTVPELKLSGVDLNVSKPSSRSSAVPNSSTTEAQMDTGTSNSSRKTWGYVAGGVGLVALGVGGYFGMAGLSKWSEHNDHCDETGCDDAGMAAGADADTYGYLSDVGIGVGLVGVGTAAYLLLFSGDSTDEQTEDEAKTLRVMPNVTANTATVTVGGTW